MRIGLGCMRLEGDAVATIRAAVDEGVRWFDTARAYGESETWLARALESSGSAHGEIRVVTKVGMHRFDSTNEREFPVWRADGRTKTILEQARASRDALRPKPIDFLLLHAVDPKTPLSTSVRALARAKDEGLARAIGLSNITRTQLEEAMRVAPSTSPIEVVEVALGAFDDESARGGVVQMCAERGWTLLAHSPLGGPKRVKRVAGDATLEEIARSIPSRPTPIELFLAYLLHLHSCIVPIVGARRIESVRSAASSARLTLDENVLEKLDARFPSLGSIRRPKRRSAPDERTPQEVVIFVGIAGAGKSRVAREYVSRGFFRLNRDESGGTLRAMADAMEERIAAGQTRIVVDNTHLSRASRNDLVAVAHRTGARVRCVFFDTPLFEAQINVALRSMSDDEGDHPEVRPLVLHRMFRELEPPSIDEGFDEIEVVPFVRSERDEARGVGAAIAMETVAIEREDEIELRDEAATIVARTPQGAPCLLFAWRPNASDDWRARAHAIASELATRTQRTIDLGVCAHPSGPPRCWCRPPLPGLWIAFVERRKLRLKSGVMVASSSAHATMARALDLVGV